MFGGSTSREISSYCCTGQQDSTGSLGHLSQRGAVQKACVRIIFQDSHDEKTSHHRMQQAFDEGQQVEPASEKTDQRYRRKIRNTAEERKCGFHPGLEQASKGRIHAAFAPLAAKNACHLGAVHTYLCTYNLLRK